MGFNRRNRLIKRILSISLEAVFCAALFFSGCAGVGIKGGPDDSSALEAETEYLINPKDVLEIQIYPDADLNRELAVSPKGTISFPLIGEVQVEGLSVTNAEKKLTALLEKDYLVYPQVHIRIKEFHTLTISLLGEVNRPGPYKLGQEGETTLLEAIAMAGGFSNIANVKKIKIIRVEGGEKKTYLVNGEDILKGEKKDVPLKANDLIVVEQSWF